jgi:hypothetical protein
MTTAAWKHPLDAVPPEPLRCECCRRRLERPGVARRFGLLDAMILVAATAAPLSLARSALSLEHAGLWQKLLVMTPALLGGWTVALLAIRLRSPRPTLRRLLRQPGAAASLAAVSTIAVCLLFVGIALLVRFLRFQSHASAIRQMNRVIGTSRPVLFDWPMQVIGTLSECMTLVGPAVLGAWVVLALGGRRRPERGLIDGLGRLVGVAWIVLFVGVALLRLIGKYHY